MHEFGDQVGLVKQAGILDGHCGLGSQDLQQFFILICEICVLFVDHFQHAHHLVLGDQWNPEQAFGSDMHLFFDAGKMA